MRIIIAGVLIGLATFGLGFTEPLWKMLSLYVVILTARGLIP